VLRSLWLLGLYLLFLGLGTTTPFVMTLGYVWVDTFRPQEVAWFILNELPVAMIIGAGAFATYFAMDRRSPPPLTLASVMQVSIAIWMTATLLWAELPDRAWMKWDAAFKSVLFAAFVPLAIRSRVQIEAFVTTWVFSLAANFIPFGLKTLISGGGYGVHLGLQNTNAGLGEGGQLSTFCLMAVPLVLYLGKWGQLLPKVPMAYAAYFGAAILAIVAALGTYERSAIIGLVALGFYMFLRSRRKILYLMVAGAVAVVLIGNMASSWNERVVSIGDYNTDGSSLTRILVWKWTLGYVATHPLGGSFDSYGVNTIVMPDNSVQQGRAFHSIYFEVLGELGWPGLAMFLTAVAASFFNLLRLSRKYRKSPDLAWVSELSDAIQSGLLVFLTAGAFVGIAFQPPFWYFVSMSICLRAFAWRAERADATEATGWRLAAQRNREALAGGTAWSAVPKDEPSASAQSWRDGRAPPAPSWRSAGLGG
jgi:probable O-glycosylation ligase (exosortase A-associated)